MVFTVPNDHACRAKICKSSEDLNFNCEKRTFRNLGPKTWDSAFWMPETIAKPQKRRNEYTWCARKVCLQFGCMCHDFETRLSSSAINNTDAYEGDEA